MFLIISNDKNKLSKAIKSSASPIFAYFLSEDKLDLLPENHLPIKTVIIDRAGGLRSTKALYTEIKSLFPSSSIGVILSEEQTATSMFRYVPEADKELISPFSDGELIDFLSSLCKSDIPSVSPSLICTPFESYLLGYDMKLSRSENRILLFLSIFNDRKITADNILCACLNSSAGPETARMLISRINGKAKNISCRPLILNSSDRGYFINPDV